MIYLKFSGKRCSHLPHWPRNTHGSKEFFIVLFLSTSISAVVFFKLCHFESFVVALITGLQEMYCLSLKHYRLYSTSVSDDNEWWKSGKSKRCNLFQFLLLSKNIFDMYFVSAFFCSTVLKVQPRNWSNWQNHRNWSVQKCQIRILRNLPTKCHFSRKIRLYCKEF